MCFKNYATHPAAEILNKAKTIKMKQSKMLLAQCFLLRIKTEIIIEILILSMKVFYHLFY